MFIPLPLHLGHLPLAKAQGLHGFYFPFLIITPFPKHLIYKHINLLCTTGSTNSWLSYSHRLVVVLTNVSRVLYANLDWLSLGGVYQIGLPVLLTIALGWVLRWGVLRVALLLVRVLIRGRVLSLWGVALGRVLSLWRVLSLLWRVALGRELSHRLLLALWRILSHWVLLSLRRILYLLLSHRILGLLSLNINWLELNINYQYSWWFPFVAERDVPHELITPLYDLSHRENTITNHIITG